MIDTSPPWCASLVNWFKLFAMPDNVRRCPVSSFDSLGLISEVFADCRNQSLIRMPAFLAFPAIAKRSVGVILTTSETLRVMAFFGRPRLRVLPSVFFSFANFFISEPPQVYGLRPSGASAVPHLAKRGGTVFCIAKK